jgi:peptidyl-prolyl cis-trans isomerase B (cyclophilin B)
MCICVTLMIACVMPASAMAQLIPDQLYFGVGRRVVVTVDVPEDSFAEPSIRLLDAATLEEIAVAPAAKGRVDLASLFPTLWSEKPEQVMLAQLYLDRDAVGAPLVIQPLMTPNAARRVNPSSLRLSEDEDAVLMFQDEIRDSREAQGQERDENDRVIFSGVRIYVEQEAVLETSAGEIVFRMRPDAAPNTAFNFMHLIEGGFYTSIIFHRVKAELDDGRPFVIQVGDPSGTGFGGPGYNIDLEKSPLGHDFGVLSMARTIDPDTNGSQIFVGLSREGTSFLDGRYTSFAQAVSGVDAILAIAGVPVDADDRPLDPPMLMRAYLRDAPPIPERLLPVTRDDAGRFEPAGPDR